MSTQVEPYLTASIPGIGGVMRTTHEDFQVDERPLYLPCGEGEHLYLNVTKRGLSTPDLVKNFSAVLGVKAQAIGVAGLRHAGNSVGYSALGPEISIRGSLQIDTARGTQSEADRLVQALRTIGQRAWSDPVGARVRVLVGPLREADPALVATITERFHVPTERMRFLVTR